MLKKLPSSGRKTTLRAYCQQGPTVPGAAKGGFTVDLDVSFEMTMHPSSDSPMSHNALSHA